jgi:hypothetical protein
MNTFIAICLVLSAVSVVGVLVLGIACMAKGGEFNKKYGNKLMQARVMLQGSAILLLAIAYFSSHK